MNPSLFKYIFSSLTLCDHNGCFNIVQCEYRKNMNPVILKMVSVQVIHVYLTVYQWKTPCIEPIKWGTSTERVYISTDFLQALFLNETSNRILLNGPSFPLVHSSMTSYWIDCIHVYILQSETGSELAHQHTRQNPEPQFPGIGEVYRLSATRSLDLTFPKQAAQYTQGLSDVQT